MTTPSKTTRSSKASSTATTASASPLAIPDDLDVCQALITQLHETLHRKEREISQLEHRLQQLLKARYGPRADRLDPNQLVLFAAELIEEASRPEESQPAKNEEAKNEKAKNGKARRRGHGRRPLPENLPRQRVVHDLSDDEKLCPCCGKTRNQISEEVSEQLELIPASLYVIEHVRRTYACKDCQGQLVTADKPTQPIEKGLAGPGLLAQVITSKYGDHQPLYRQEHILARSGANIPRSTTCGWMASCASLVKPLVAYMTALVMQSKVIHTDDTTVPVLDPKRGKTRTGRIWVYAGDETRPYTVFDYTPTHAREGPEEFFGDYAGYIQADAHSVYDQLFKPRGDGKPAPLEVGCWAHTRRKFVEAEHTDAPRAHTAAAMIRVLYQIERECRDLDTEARRALRQERAVPQLAKMHTWLEAQLPAVLPKSPMGGAIAYGLSNWTALTRYTEDGDLAIDNNAAERALRPVTLGRKNWLFAGSDKGGQTGATLMSLVASCKRHGLDPFVYLRDLLTRLPATPVNQLDQFLPDHWKAAHPTTTLPTIEE